MYYKQNVASKFKNVVVKCQVVCETANAIVQAFYARHCDHAPVKNLVVRYSALTVFRYI